MAQSLSRIYVHIIFSTKNRVPLLAESIRPDLFRYIAGIVKTQKSSPVRIGGTADHVHILCDLGRTTTIAKLIEEIKTGSSKWLKAKDASFRDFQWQSGYGAFSVSQSSAPDVIAYIDNQEEHHRKRTFQEEFRLFLQRYGIEYEERYLDE